jgi:uncharacterized damage-inducible protein DinB
MIQDLKNQFLSGINQLETELNAYSSNELLWKTEGDIKNSAGNLFLHLEGNLRHFIGHVLGGSTYVRKRELEFSSSDVSTSELLEGIKLCRQEITVAFDNLSPQDLSNKFPIDVMNRVWTNQQFLLHLLGHLNYHLGQINYHRRLFSTDY